MGQSQARKWRARHDHVARVGRARLFLLEERVGATAARPRLSVRDVVELLDWYFRARKLARARQK